MVHMVMPIEKPILEQPMQTLRKIRIVRRRDSWQSIDSNPDLLQEARTVLRAFVGA